MNKKLLLIGCVAMALTTACEQSTKEKLGLVKSAPDEFSVVTRAPLAVPPDYALRPPRPGAGRPMEMSTRDNARQTIFGADDVNEKGVATNQNDAESFLGKIGANDVDPNIRYELDTADGVDTRTTAEKLLFMSPKSSDGGESLDPVAERERLTAENVIVEKRNEDIVAP